MPKFNNTPNKCITHEGKDYWISRSVACTCIVAIASLNYKEVKYLMGLRGPSMTDFPYHWNIICGYIDWNEQMLECVKRELWEEAGIDIDAEGKNVISFYDQPWQVDTNPTSNRQNITLNCSVLFGTAPSMKINNDGDGEEVLDLKWFTIDELESIKDKIAFNHYEKIHTYHNTIMMNDV